MHWTKQDEEVKYAHVSVLEALQGVKWKQYKDKVNITITAYLKRPIDPDNVCDKLLIDGIKLCGLIEDDTGAFVNQATTRVMKAKDDYTVIEIDEV